MNFDFGKVITRAWEITWKHKILWIFGILAGCSRGGGGGSGGSSYQTNGGNGNAPFGQDFERTFDQLSAWLTDNWWVVAVIVLVLLVLAILSIFLGTIGRIGLIRGTLQAEQGAETLSFGELFSGSIPFFWRVFGLTFLIGVIFLLILLPMLALGAVTAGVAFLCLVPLFCLLVPVAIAVNLILELANVAMVKENLGLVDGWKRGFEIARTNAGPVIVMALILFVISFVIGLILAIPIILIVAPAVIGLAMGNGQDMTPLLVAGLCFVIFLPVAWLVSGVLYTFTGASWTLTYLRLTNKPEEQPIVLPTEANV